MGSPPPVLTNPQSESTITSLLFPLKVSHLLTLLCKSISKKMWKVLGICHASASRDNLPSYFHTLPTSPWDVPAQRREARQAVSAVLQEPSSQLTACVALLQPAWVANHFLWFLASPTSPRTSPHGLKQPFPPHSQQRCQHSCSVEVSGLPSLSHFLRVVHYLQLFLWRFLLSHTGIYSISCTSPLHKCLILPPFQTSQLPLQCLGHTCAPRQFVHGLLQSQDFPL